MKRCLLGALLILMSAHARAELIEISYTEFAINTNALLEEIASAAGLDESFTYTAKRVAAYWTHIGPCRGDARAVPESDFSIVTNPNPRISYNAAVLQMVAVLNTTNLGREPTSHVCQFARDMAKH